MTLTNEHKSLLITLLLSATVVLIVFSFHIKKQNELVAETFYELLPENDEFLEQKEDLEDLIKSFDNLKTNRAFDESKAFDDFEDEDFKSTMEKLNNRHNTDENAVKNESLKNINSSPNPNEDNTYNDINEIIKKRSGNDANRLGTSSFSLVDRELIYLPTPIYLCEEGGKIVVNIEVNDQGEVTNAYFNNASTSSNGCMVDHAIEYAKQARFDINLGKSSQLGSITFYFKPKQ